VNRGGEICQVKKTVERGSRDDPNNQHLVEIGELTLPANVPASIKVVAPDVMKAPAHVVPGANQAAVTNGGAKTPKTALILQTQVLIEGIIDGWGSLSTLDVGCSRC